MSQKFLNPVEVNGQVSAEYIDLSTSTSHSVNAGEIAWNSVDGTFDIGLLNGVTLQAGQEMHFYGKATEAISNGNAVMFAGVQGDHILIAKADAVTINANPEYFMGVATQDFSTNDFGYVTAFGNVRGINTSAYTLGDILYYDSTSATDGLLTPAEPSAPKAKIIVAAVVKVHATQGILAVRPHTMPRLKDIQDINIDTASAGEILQLQSDGVWENKTLSEAGIQPTLTNPVTGTGTTNYVAKFTGTTSLGNSQIFDNGTNVGIGTTSPNRRLTVNGLVTASNESSTVGDGAFVATGGSPTIVQTLQRTSGGFAYSMFQGFANNTTTGLTSLLVDYGVLGNLNSGVTPPNIAYSYFSVGSSSAYNNTYMRLHNNAEKQITVDGRLSIGTTASTSGARLDVRAQGALSTDIAFRVRNSTDTTDLFNVNGLGNVGIGTTSPTEVLDVKGALVTRAPRVNNLGEGGFIDYNNGEFRFVSQGPTTTAGSYSFTVRESDLGGSINAMFISNTGRVGIGTTGPNFSLDVNGDGRFQTNLTIGLTTNNNGTRTVFNGSTAGRSFQIANNWNVGGSFEITPSTTTAGSTFTTPALVINGTTSNVGIGTTSPSYKLDLGVSNGMRLGSLNIVDGGSQIAINSSLLRIYSGTGVKLSYFNGTSIVDGLLMNSSGNVGIGNTSPTQKLDVNGNIKISNNNSLMFRNAANNADISIIQLTNTNQLNLGTTSSSAPSVIALHTNSAERMRIDANGNVGIGTTSPSTNLHVLGNSFSVNPSVIITHNPGFSPEFIELSAGAFDGGGIVNVGSTSSIIFKRDGNESMRINGSGNVGIGTSNPLAKLHVAGTSALVSDFANIDVTNDAIYMGGKNYSGMYLEDGVASFGYSPVGDFRGVRANYTEGVWFINESGCKLGLQPVDNNLWSEGNIIQTTDVPSNTTTPAAWVKIYNNDNSSFYFMPVYQ